MKTNILANPLAPDNDQIGNGVDKARFNLRNSSQPTRFDNFSVDLSHDREEGEVRILERRFAVVDIAAFCQRWDALVGKKVAGVQMKSLEYHLGVEDAEAIMRKTPNATPEETILHLQEADRISGVGVTKATMVNPDLIHIEIRNPVVAGTEGAAAFFASGWWCGAADTVLKGRFDVADTIYDEEKNLLKFNLKARPAQKA
jgi:hypothetical protein